jgi:DNA-binding NtrC family response regulator
MERILVIDCDHDSRAEIRERLLRDGHEVIACESGEGAIAALDADIKVVVISRAPRDVSATLLLRRSREVDAEIRVILTSSSGNEQLEALQGGAYYATRAPMSSEEVALLVRRALMSREIQAKYSSIWSSAAFHSFVLIGNSPGLRTLREAISRLSAKPTVPVLIVGESGVGKNTAASALHAETTPTGPFVHLPHPCNPETPLDLVSLSNKAAGGSLHLGDLADIPVPIQDQLLGLLRQHGEHLGGLTSQPILRARLLATSTQPIDAAVSNGLVRPELAYRLGVVTLQVPPLRQRREDIPLLVEHFLHGLSTSSRRGLRGVTSGVMKQLVEYTWPGNLRELRTVLESAALLSNGEYLDSVRLRHSPAQAQASYRLPSNGIAFRELEREVLVQALKLAAGNQTRAALLLGLTRDQIRYRMSKFGMTNRALAGSGDRAA